jgi:tetratricopeptide (TPR) repeat protein
VLEYSAVRLYLQQARCVQPGYEPGDEALAQSGRICRMAEGMPLAIMLAAAWMDVLAPGEIVDELERSVTFLRGELRDLPERHRSMVAAFDVSWRMLSEAEREAFAALSVFRGGCTREAAEAVAGADLEILRALIRKSFLTCDADGRYQIHELLRQYAERKLRERPEAWERVRERHCAYYAEYLVQHGESFARLGPREAPLEIDNVGIAWRRMLDQGKLAECRRAMKGLFWFDQEWAWCRARLSLLEDTIALLRRAEPSRENRIALGVALCYASRPGSGADRRYLRALAREGHQILAELDARYELAESKLIAYFAGAAEDDAHAGRLLQEGLSLAQETGRPDMEAWALEWLADRYFTHSIEAGSSGGEMWRQAQASYSRSLEIRRRLGYGRGEAILLAKQALSAYAEGRHAEARSLYDESLARFRAMGERDWILVCLGEFGMLALTMGDYRVAKATFQEYLETAQAWGDPVSARYALCGLSDLALARGEAGKALRIRRRALQGAIEDGGLAAERILFSFAQLSAQEGRHVRAVELLTLVYAIVSPSLRCVVMVCGSADLERVLRSALSPDAYAAAQERGRARDVEGTLRELLAELEDEGLPDPP